MDKAIISRIEEAGGPRVYALGIGETESDARRAAYEWTNRSLNSLDKESQGGELVDADPAIARLQEAGYDCGVVIDDAGVLRLADPSKTALLENQ